MLGLSYKMGQALTKGTSPISPALRCIAAGSSFRSRWMTGVDDPRIAAICSNGQQALSASSASSFISRLISAAVESGWGSWGG